MESPSLNDSGQDRTHTETTGKTGDNGGSHSQPSDSNTHPPPQREEEDVQPGGPMFNPPVYSQRYKLVQDVLMDHKVESVVDFGCAECKMIHFLKNVKTLQRIALVDLDEHVLKKGLHCGVKPTIFEFVIRRTTPLTVSVFKGSAGDLDGRVDGFQAASLVEIIEHLHPNELEQVTQNVFGRLSPSLVIVTTPNADFNVLFPRLAGFRHWDHKFEWTRQEFQHWCEAICKQHGYAVRYMGVGCPPAEMSHVGFCSQVAIFTKASGKDAELTEKLVYTLVEEVVYPYDKRSPAERLEMEIDFKITSLTKRETSDEDTQPFKYSATRFVSWVLDGVQSKFKETWQNEDVLAYLRRKYTLTDDESGILVEPWKEEEEEESGWDEEWEEASLDREEQEEGDGLTPSSATWAADEEEEWT